MKYTCLVLTCLFLSACGGSSDDDTDIAISTSPLLISENNASELSAAIMSSTLDGREPVDTELINVLTFLAGGSASYFDEQAPQKVHIASSVDEDVPCAISGNASVSISTGDEEQLGVNDSTSIRFNNCSSTSDEVINGAISMTLTEVSEDIDDSTDFTIGYLFSLDKLRVSSSGEFVEVDGDINMRVSNSAEEGSTTTVSSASMTVDENGDVSRLTNYSQSTSISFLTGVTSLTTSGTFSSAQLGGSVTFTTTEPFTASFNNDAPASGTMVITGADNTSMTLTALNSVDVTLEIDSDGDGNIDETINTNWDELGVFSGF